MVRRYLFYNDLNSRLNEWTQVIKEDIRELPHDRVVGCTDDKLIEYFQDKYRLEPPQILFDTLKGAPLSATVANPSVRVTVGYIDSNNLLQYKPLSLSGGILEFDVYNGLLSFTIDGGNPEHMNREHDRIVSYLKNNLEKITQAINAFNDGIPFHVRNGLVERRKTAHGHEDFLAKLNIPLNRKDSPLVEIPPLRQKLTPKLPEPGSPDEPVLLEDTYKHILKICGDMALAMEQSPDVFVELKTENQFRVLFLVLLNGNYEGAVTAETFNLEGKTDICFKHKGRNLFIAECKIWHGVEGHKDAIDQLLKYTQWRDSKTALMVFAKEQDFSGIKEKMFAATKTHPNYLEELSSHDTDTSRRYRFSNKEDSKQTFFLTVMAFHIRPRMQPNEQLPDET